MTNMAATTQSVAAVAAADPLADPPDPEALEALAARLGAARDAVGRVILGQEAVVEQALITLLAGGHALLVGLPGLGKSKLVETLAIVLGLDQRRVQFTPDLMPPDITGSEVLDDAEGARRFRFLPGPVFCQLLMADEINRASPRTQSALLQAMQERRVSAGGADHPLPVPFHVLATQNPLEQEGTYPLPEAQLDRFLLQIDVGYPSLAAERALLLATTGPAEAAPEPVLDAAGLIAAQRLLRALPVAERVLEAILALVRAARPGPEADPLIARHVVWGPGPRGAQALLAAARARAVLDLRLSPSLDDVAALALPALRHRMAVGFAARAEGVTVETMLTRLIERIG
jgi:MoxR-like ATPase